MFVQASLFDAESLVADARATALSVGVSLDIYYLDSDQDGIARISEILSHYRDLDAIQFVSHGADGMIQLGGSWLTNWTIENHVEDLQSWGMALSSRATFLIYGCDVAGSEYGQGLVDRIAELTGGDVAASIDSTGDVSRGGDWELEYVSSGASQSVERCPQPFRKITE